MYVCAAYMTLKYIHTLCIQREKLETSGSLESEPKPWD